MSFQSLMNKTVVVKRISKISDNMGGFSESETTIYSSMPCRIQVISGNERPVYGVEKLEASVKMFYEDGYDLTTADKIVFGIREFDVLFIRSPEEMGHHNECHASERIL